MPRPSRLRRLIGVLTQMLDIVHSRTVLRDRDPPNADDTRILRQRQHVEWLCDHDINAFRSYTHADLRNGRVIPLSSMRASVTWGHDNRDVDRLYYASRPLVFYMPASVSYLALDDLGDDRHWFCVELLPLALQDIIGLDYLASFSRPMDDDYPRGVVISSYLTGDELFVKDYAFGNGVLDALWSEVFLDDYVLVELSVSRAYDSTRSWSLVFNLLAATRITTTP